jgi:hypothetical protein
MTLRDLIISEPYPPGYTECGERRSRSRRPRRKRAPIPLIVRQEAGRATWLARLSRATKRLCQVMAAIEKGADPDDCAQTVDDVISRLRIVHALLTDEAEERSRK